VSDVVWTRAGISLFGPYGAPPSTAAAPKKGRKELRGTAARRTPHAIWARAGDRAQGAPGRTPPSLFLYLPALVQGHAWRACRFTPARNTATATLKRAASPPWRTFHLRHCAYGLGHIRRNCDGMDAWQKRAGRDIWIFSRSPMHIRWPANWEAHLLLPDVTVRWTVALTIGSSPGRPPLRACGACGTPVYRLPHRHPAAAYL